MKRRLFNSTQVKSLMPYFWLALAVILVWRTVNELEALFAFIGRVWGIITPFFYGFVLAYILSIPCGGLQKLLLKTKSNFISKRKKALSILLVYLLFLLILFLIFSTVAPYVHASILHFIENWEAYYQTLHTLVAQLEKTLGTGIHILDQIEENVRNFFTLDRITENITSYLQASLDAIFGVGAALFNGFIAFIASIYILFEKDTFKKYLSRLLWVFTPEKCCDITHKYARKLDYNFKQYIYTQTLDSMIIAPIIGVQLWIIGSPYALTLALLLGVLNYIPYFGSIVGTLIAVLIVMLTQGFTMGAIALVALLITQQLDGNYIQPKLMSGSFSISPFLVIISVTVGGAFGGVFGMIVAIPIVAVAKDMIEDFVSYYEAKKAPPKPVGEE